MVWLFLVAFCLAAVSYLVPIPAEAQSGGNKPAGQESSSGGVSEKEAFEAAKELNTIESWEAFLNNFSSGFRADLARAYLKRLTQEMGAGDTPKSQPSAPAQSAPAAQPANQAPASQPAAPQPQKQLQMLDLGPGVTPWQTGNTALSTTGNQSVYSASVQGNGMELVTYCQPGAGGHNLHAVIRENPRGQYPDFAARIKQGQSAQGGQMTFDNGRNFGGITLAEQPGSGEVMIGFAGQAISQGPALKEIMGANSMTILAPPFAATFQLRSSRRAICDVFKRCGAANHPECRKYAPRPRAKPKPRPRPKPKPRPRPGPGPGPGGPGPGPGGPGPGPGGPGSGPGGPGPGPGGGLPGCPPGTIANILGICITR